MEQVDIAKERQNQLRLLGKGHKGLSGLITHTAQRKSLTPTKLLLAQLGEQDHPMKDKLAYLGKPQQKLASYLPWVEAARLHDEQVPVQYTSLRLSQLGSEKGRRPYQLEHIGLRFTDLLKNSLSFPTPEHEYQSKSKLLSLPDEILLYIFWFIIQSELINRENLIGGLETVCKRFWRLSNSPELWRLMCSLIGGLPHSNYSLPLFQSWRRSYFDWTENVRFGELDVMGAYMASDRNIFAEEASWHSARYLVVHKNKTSMDEKTKEICQKIRHKHLARLFEVNCVDDYYKITTEHSGYCHLWSKEYMCKIETQIPTERFIRQIVIQIIESLDYLLHNVLSSIELDKCVMLFTAWPCSIFFSTTLHQIKLAFWWYDLLNTEIDNPDPRKYLFVAPEIILGNKLHHKNQSFIWCLGVTLFSMLTLRFPFGGVNFPPVRVLMSILDETPDFESIEWGNISPEAKDLVMNLLVKDPLERYSVEQIRNHPWLTGEVPNTPLEIYRSLRNTSVYRCFSPKTKRQNTF